MNWGMFAAGLVLGLVFGFVVPGFAFAPETAAVFSPEDGQEVLDLIDSAEDSIDIEVYVFTSRDVIDALERARRRGVSIRVIVEKRVMGGENGEVFRELSAKGFDIRYASQAYQLTHSKFIIVDGEKVLVGSHNLSNSALFRNREASVILSDDVTVGEFEAVFEADWRISSFP